MTREDQELCALHAAAPALRDALEAALEELSIAASYAEHPSQCPTAGLLIHAKSCAKVVPQAEAALAAAKGEQ